MYSLAPNPWPIQPSRASDLRASLTVLDQGGPALLGYRPGTHTPVAIGYSDDQGIYVIVPELSHLLGQSDPIAVLRWLWVAAWAVALLFSGIVARSLLRSGWAAFTAPPTLLVCIFSFGFGDIYWVTAWAIVALMPLLLLLERRRPRGLHSALVLIALVAGVASAVRSEAGLPVALGAIAVTALAGGRTPLRVAAAATVILAYLAPTTIVLPAIRAHRDHRSGLSLSANEPTSHPLWHSLYIGLGYTPNRYGIHYADRYAIAAAGETDPGARFLSPAYARALHRQVDRLIRSDPSFVAKAEGQKAVVELAHAGRYLLLLALLLPGALTARGSARLRPGELALFLPALAIGALPAIVAAPYRDYELMLLATLGTLGLLAIGSTAARAEAGWPVARPRETEMTSATRAPGARPAALVRRTRLALGELWRDWPTRTTLRALLVAGAVVAVAFAFARHFEAEHERWDQGEPSAPTVVLAGAHPSLAGRRA
jgi:hypothetical protein